MNPDHILNSPVGFPREQTPTVDPSEIEDLGRDQFTDLQIHSTKQRIILAMVEQMCIILKNAHNLDGHTRKQICILAEGCKNMARLFDKQ